MNRRLRGVKFKLLYVIIDGDRERCHDPWSQQISLFVMTVLHFTTSSETPRDSPFMLNL